MDRQGIHGSQKSRWEGTGEGGGGGGSVPVQHTRRTRGGAPW
eukprot:COSAG01_NODE_197_length_22333_cov_45.774759_1_plen_41_part_10